MYLFTHGRVTDLFLKLVGAEQAPNLGYGHEGDAEDQHQYDSYELFPLHGNKNSY